MLPAFEIFNIIMPMISDWNSENYENFKSVFKSKNRPSYVRALESRTAITKRIFSLKYSIEPVFFL